MTTMPLPRPVAAATDHPLHLLLFVGQTADDDAFYETVERIRSERHAGLHVVDVWEDPGIAVAFDVRTVPTLVGLIDGNEVVRITGAAGAAHLRKTLIAAGQA